MDNYSTIKDVTTTLGLSLSPGDMTTNQVKTAPTFLQSLRRNKGVMAFVTVSVGVVGMMTGSHYYAASSSNNTMAQASIDHYPPCGPTYTYCKHQLKCPTGNCPTFSLECKYGSCYKAGFPRCVHVDDNPSFHWEVQCY